MSVASGPSESFTYDLLGRITAVTKTFSYTYNLDGSLATLTYPSGRVVTYSYNAAGRALSAVDVANSINYATGASYAAHGALLSVVNGQAGGFSGITRTSSYSNRLQPVTLTAATSTATVMSFTYDFDSDPAAGVQNNGNVGKIINNVNTARTQTFTYDELNRIKSGQTQATSGSSCWGLDHGYDVWGNLLSISAVAGYGACTQSSLSITVNTSNRISSGGFTYDAAGNLTNYSGSAYTYDAENRLLTAGGVTSTYDGDGRRVKKSNGTLYWYGAGSSVLMETDLSGNLQDEYIFFNGQRVARRTSAGVVYYFLSDHLGSNRIVTNATGGIVEDSDFFPFGSERPIVDTLNNNYKFTGHERDGESGLDFMVGRHYAFTLGRFLQPDAPFADQQTASPQSWNLYSYVRNNPLKFIDPTGRAGCSWNPCGMGSAGILPAHAGYGPTMETTPVFGDIETAAEIFGFVNADNQSTSVTILGESVPVTIDVGLSEDAKKHALSKVGESAKNINENADKLSKAEKKVIKSIKAIHVTKGASGVDVVTGKFSINFGELGLSTIAYFASVIAHDGYHVGLYKAERRQRITKAERIQAERWATRFQIEVGKKLGLTQDEIRHLEKHYKNPSRY